MKKWMDPSINVLSRVIEDAIQEDAKSYNLIQGTVSNFSKEMQ
jgi:hypothetical protein